MKSLHLVRATLNHMNIIFLFPLRVRPISHTPEADETMRVLLPPAFTVTQCSDTVKDTLFPFQFSLETVQELCGLFSSSELFRGERSSEVIGSSLSHDNLFFKSLFRYFRRYPISND